MESQAVALFDGPRRENVPARRKYFKIFSAVTNLSVKRYLPT
jgi:hypothetical protein